MARRILVTGANKGVGLAIVRRCLLDFEDTHLILGCRSRQRGQEAVETLAKESSSWRSRVSLLELDTSSDASVQRAAEALWGELGLGKDQSQAGTLYAIVNNAGIASGTVEEIFQTNVHGPRRVDAAFIPFLDPVEGRIVNISSGAGPRCVQSSTPERKTFFTNPCVTWPGIVAVMDEVLALSGDSRDDLWKIGIGSMRGPGSAAYGLSKALLNCYTVQMARDNPKLKINACSPGAISTDLFKSSRVACFLRCFTADPDQGTVAPMHLLFAELEGNGCFYHKTAEKRPLDEY